MLIIFYFYADNVTMLQYLGWIVVAYIYITGVMLENDLKKMRQEIKELKQQVSDVSNIE